MGQERNEVGGRRTIDSSTSKTAIKDYLCTFGGVGRHLDDVFVAAAGTSAVERAFATHCVVAFEGEIK